MKRERLVWFFLVSVLLCGILVFPASAALNTVTQGGTVFIGEQGLDITQAMDGYTKIAWWAPGTSPGTDQPADVETISVPTNFAASPTIFAGRLNNWYRYSGGVTPQGIAFYVKEPAADLKLLDLTILNTMDVTNKAVRSGDLVDVEVQSDLYLIKQRDPGKILNCDIKVKGPGGNVYTSLYTLSGLRDLRDLPLTSNPWYWSSYNGNNPLSVKAWETGAKDGQGFLVYSPGTYEIWLDCEQNNLNFTSAPITVQLYEDKLDLTIKESTVVRGNRTYATITGVPNTWYMLWVKDCSGTMTGFDCDQPPMMTYPQAGVTFDNEQLHFGDAWFDCSGCQKTVFDTVPHYPDNGRWYYALVLTDEEGTRTVEFQTTTATKPKVYTFRAQTVIWDQEIYLGDTYIEKPLNVVKGEINFLTFVYGKPANVAYLGDTVRINGTNKDSRTTYLFITGPCQDCVGAALTYPNNAVVNNNPDTFTQVPVKADGTWEYVWYTEQLKIDLGNYTIYAASKPNDRSALENSACNNCSSFTPSCAAWTKKPFTFLQPTLRGDVNPKVVNIECCRNIPIIVNGSSTGNEQLYPYVGMWIFGENKVAGLKYVFTTIPVNCPEGTFKTDISQYINTLKLESGIYTIVLQHPMYNHVFDILPEDQRYGGVYSPELNRKFVVGSSPVQWSKLFVIDGPDRLIGTQALNALLAAFDNPNIDDIDLVLKFRVENPNPLVADFSALTTTGPAPLTVQFTDTSSGSPTSYLWNFGDNSSTTTVQNPAHTYYQTGTYTVSLTVGNGGISSTTTKNGYITVTGVTPTPTPTPPIPGSDSISLYTGWNFVSTPKTLAVGQNTAGVVFAGVDTAAHSIFQYNALSHAWVPMNSSTLVEPLNGIWIYSKNAMQVPLHFRNSPLETPPTKQLYAGWNAIGSGEAQPVSAQNTLMTVQNAWAKLLGFNAAAQAYESTIFNSNPSYQSPVYPTKGYWVFMSSDGIYS